MSLDDKDKHIKKTCIHPHCRKIKLIKFSISLIDKLKILKLIVSMVIN